MNIVRPAFRPRISSALVAMGMALTACGGGQRQEATGASTEASLMTGSVLDGGSSKALPGAAVNLVPSSGWTTWGGAAVPALDASLSGIIRSTGAAVTAIHSLQLTPGTTYTLRTDKIVNTSGGTAIVYLADGRQIRATDTQTVTFTVPASGQATLMIWVGAGQSFQLSLREGVQTAPNLVPTLGWTTWSGAPVPALDAATVPGVIRSTGASVTAIHALSLTPGASYTLRAGQVDGTSGGAAIVYLADGRQIRADNTQSVSFTVPAQGASTLMIWVGAGQAFIAELTADGAAPLNWVRDDCKAGTADCTRVSGNFYVTPNFWNPPLNATQPYGVGAGVSAPYADGSVDVGIRWNFPARYGAQTYGLGVLAYPEVVFGVGGGYAGDWANQYDGKLVAATPLPAPVNRISRMQLGSGPVLGGASKGRAHLAYDLWLTQGRPRNVQMAVPELFHAVDGARVHSEIMIPVVPYNGYGVPDYPAAATEGRTGTKFGRFVSPYKGRARIDGQVYDVYRARPMAATYSTVAGKAYVLGESMRRRVVALQADGQPATWQGPAGQPVRWIDGDTGAVLSATSDYPKNDFDYICVQAGLGGGNSASSPVTWATEVGQTVTTPGGARFMAVWREWSNPQQFIVFERVWGDSAAYPGVGDGSHKIDMRAFLDFMLKDMTDESKWIRRFRGLDAADQAIRSQIDGLGAENRWIDSSLYMAGVELGVEPDNGSETDTGTIGNLTVRNFKVDVTVAP